MLRKPEYQAVKATTGHKTKGKAARLTHNRKGKHILPALAAVGGACSLFAGAASALELGDIRINSALGQPLRASISYALNPNEQLFDFCIYLRPDPTMAGVPTISRPRITVDNGTIFLAGSTPILEPILSMHVSVDCPYTANLAREYTLMINPAGTESVTASLAEEAAAPEPLQTAQNAPVTTAVQQPVAIAPNAPVAKVSEPQVEKPTPVVQADPQVVEQTTNDPVPLQSLTDPISVNSRYFVQAGDSLSSIARRIQNRPVGLWPAVNAIFAANPDAFVDGDRNQLTAAMWLEIPSFSDSYVADVAAGTDFADSGYSNAAPVDTYAGFDGADVTPQSEESFTDTPATDEFEPVATVVEPVIEPVAEAVAEPAADPVIDTVVEADVTADDTAPVPQPELIADEAPVEAQTSAETESEQVAIVDDTAVLRPGDVVVDDTSSAESSVPVVAVVSRSNVAAEGYFGVTKWIVLAGGSALALMLAFFAFGRTLKERIAARKAVAPEIVDELFDDEDTTESEIIDDVDFPFEETPDHSQSISLDADLGEGTGLQDSSDLDVAQDFGFSATATGEVETAVESEIDLELPEEAPAAVELLPTDIIEPSHRIEEALHAEETPAAEDTQRSAAIEDGGDYDLSMIVDATKQPLVEEELTARDLMAVRVDDGQEAANDVGSQTLASEVDIAILEQDYEEEFTQTMALNEEIARAAEELALRMQDDDDTAEVTSRLETVEDPAMTATVQAQVEAGNDDLTEIADFNEPDEATAITDLDDTGISAQLTANLNVLDNELTAAVPQAGSDKTVEMPPPGSEQTVEMPNPGNEPTVEMANPGNDATVEMPLKSGEDHTK